MDESFWKWNYGGCRFAMRIFLLGRFANASQPAAGEQWPERHRSRNDQQAKAPTPMSSMRVNPAHARPHKRNGEQQTAKQVSSKRD
jgi:hypothetical protein